MHYVLRYFSNFDQSWHTFDEYGSCSEPYAIRIAEQLAELFPQVELQSGEVVTVHGSPRFLPTSTQQFPERTAK